MRKLRVGVDIVDVRDVAESLDRFGEKYLRRVFSDAELASTGDATASQVAARLVQTNRDARRYERQLGALKEFALPNTRARGRTIGLEAFGGLAKHRGKEGDVTALNAQNVTCIGFPQP